MKQLFLLGLILTLFAAAATAQQTGKHQLRHRELQSFHRGPELKRLHRDEMRYNLARQRARRDGIISPAERRQLHKMRRYQRYELYRMRHNSSRRLI